MNIDVLRNHQRMIDLALEILEEIGSEVSHSCAHWCSRGVSDDNSKADLNYWHQTFKVHTAVLKELNALYKKDEASYFAEE